MGVINKPTTGNPYRMTNWANWTWTSFPVPILCVAKDVYPPVVIKLGTGKSSIHGGSLTSLSSINVGCSNGCEGHPQ